MAYPTKQSNKTVDEPKLVNKQIQKNKKSKKNLKKTKQFHKPGSFPQISNNYKDNQKTENTTKNLESSTQKHIDELKTLIVKVKNNDEYVPSSSSIYVGYLCKEEDFPYIARWSDKN
uniref:DUF1738 domain-containing protein n=1 Tax=Rhabditophanes sp. KR3021 TaxID=114890 RepID=A0AC35UF98_9BILA